MPLDNTVKFYRCSCYIRIQCLRLERSLMIRKGTLQSSPRSKLNSVGSHEYSHGFPVIVGKESVGLEKYEEVLAESLIETHFDPVILKKHLSGNFFRRRRVERDRALRNVQDAATAARAAIVRRHETPNAG